MTNCVNCGAILHGKKCEYCGTEYGDSENEKEISEPEFDVWMDCNGILHRTVIPKYKRR